MVTAHTPCMHAYTHVIPLLRVFILLWSHCTLPCTHSRLCTQTPAITCSHSHVHTLPCTQAHTPCMNAYTHLCDHTPMYIHTPVVTCSHSHVYTLTHMHTYAHTQQCLLSPTSLYPGPCEKYLLALKNCLGSPRRALSTDRWQFQQEQRVQGHEGMAREPYCFCVARQGWDPWAARNT